MLAAQIINEDTDCANDQAAFFKIKSLGARRKYPKLISFKYSTLKNLNSHSYLNSFRRARGQELRDIGLLRLEKI